MNPDNLQHQELRSGSFAAKTNAVALSIFRSHGAQAFARLHPAGIERRVNIDQVHTRLWHGPKQFQVIPKIDLIRHSLDFNTTLDNK